MSLQISVGLWLFLICKGLIFLLFFTGILGIILVDMIRPIV